MNGFAQRLKDLRLRNGLTQDELAERCETSQQIIRGYEKDNSKPTYDSIIKICEALLVNPDYLMQDDLSFNPYEDRNETFNDIAKLSPPEYKLLKGFVELLKSNAK